MKTSTKITACVAGAAGAAYMAIGEVFRGAFLTRAGSQLTKKLLPDHDDESTIIFKTSPICAEGFQWYKDSEKTRVSTFTRDGNPCHAFFIKAEGESHKYVICCHGYSSKPADMGPYGQEFQKRGFNMLYPVLGGHDDSETGNISMGWFDRLIVVAFAQYIVDMDPEAQIVLHGVSMGGATVMMATGERMPENVKCCVEDCGYCGVWEEFSCQIKDYLHLSIFPFLNAADTATRLHNGFKYKEASALSQLRRSNTPTLFIHGDRDTFVPFWMLETNYGAAVCEKDKLIVPGATHAVSAFVDPELYWSKIDSFLAKYIK